MKTGGLFSYVKQFLRGYLNGTQEERQKTSVAVSALFSAVSVLIKLLIGLFTLSFLWLYSCVYGIGAIAAKTIAYLGIRERIDRRKSANLALVIAVVLLLSGLVFDMYMMLKSAKTSELTRFPIIIVIVASIYFFLFYIYRVKGLIQIRPNKGILFFALKIIGMSGTLMNMVLLQQMILSCTILSDSIILCINSIFGYFIGGTLVVMAVILLVRSLWERKQAQ